MPVAHCYVKESLKGTGDLLDLWANASGHSAEHMTINRMDYKVQSGNPYTVIANLYLPSLWDDKAIEKLQLGLSQSLADYFALAEQEIIVMTHIVQSGHVVEGGKVQTWD